MRRWRRGAWAWHHGLPLCESKERRPQMKEAIKANHRRLIDPRRCRARCGPLSACNGMGVAIDVTVIGAWRKQGRHGMVASPGVRHRLDIALCLAASAARRHALTRQSRALVRGAAVHLRSRHLFISCIGIGLTLHHHRVGAILSSRGQQRSGISGEWRDGHQTIIRLERSIKSIAPAMRPKMMI